jgi:hypothetical protein
MESEAGALSSIGGFSFALSARPPGLFLAGLTAQLHADAVSQVCGES